MTNEEYLFHLWPNVLLQHLTLYILHICWILYLPTAQHNIPNTLLTPYKTSRPFRLHLQPVKACVVAGGWFESKFSVQLLLIPNLAEQYLEEKCEAKKSNQHISRWQIWILVKKYFFTTKKNICYKDLNISILIVFLSY